MKVTREKGVYEVVWPSGRRVTEGATYAHRLNTLEGKTICELWDYAFQGDKIFPMVEKELARRYPGIKFVGYDTFGSTHGGDEAKTLAALKDKFKQYQCDAVISGMGC